jgi:hypothetical protein
MPFAVIFIELFFILKSIWQDQFYYMYGFLSLVFIILMVTCIEITIVIIYFQLCGEVSGPVVLLTAVFSIITQGLSVVVAFVCYFEQLSHLHLCLLVVLLLHVFENQRIHPCSTLLHPVTSCVSRVFRVHWDTGIHCHVLFLDEDI